MNPITRTILKAIPSSVVAWLTRRRAPLGERAAKLAEEEGVRRWQRGGRGARRDEFIPF